MRDPAVKPLGDRALVLEWDQIMDPAQHADIVSFARTLSFEGLLEVVPAYASLTLHVDPGAVDVGVIALRQWRTHSTQTAPDATRTIRIPVRYDGPDLPSIAASTGLSSAEVVRLHAGRVYRVYMLGFMPGFAYLGEVDPRIAAPRHATPRTRVPAGSVGIAGRQTGVYPLASPGGWQLIGSTSLRLFDPANAEPALLRAGDEVVFEAIA